MADIDLSEYREMSKKLKSAAPQVRAAMRKSLRDLAKPISEKVREEGARTLPRRGGLGSNVLSARITVGINAGGVSLLLGGRKKRKGEGQLRQIDDSGLIRHPVFGRVRKVGRLKRGKLTAGRTVTSASGWKKSPWSVTRTAPGQYTAAFLRRKEEVQDALGDEVGAILRRLT